MRTARSFQNLRAPFIASVLSSLLLFAHSFSCAPQPGGERRTAAVGTAPGELSPDYLRCEYRVAPAGIDVTNPRLSWIVTSEGRGEKQTAYRILVASSLDKLNRGEADLWDSGKVLSDETGSIEYAGEPLASRMRCFWKVRVWDAADRASAWSEAAMWSMGLFEASDWQGRWIGLEERPVQQPAREKLSDGARLDDCRWVWSVAENPQQAAPAGTIFLRRAFRLPAAGGIEKAVLRLAVDDKAVLFVNGKKIADFAGWTQGSEFSISEHLRADRNVIAIAATNEGDSPNPAGIIGKLVIEYEQADTQMLAIDDSWRVAHTRADGWQELDFDDSGWAAANQFADYGAEPWGDIEAGRLHLPPPVYLRKEFRLDRPVKRATVYASALGLYKLYINGRGVGRDYFTPGWTDYDTRVYYNTYDVTEFVTRGRNAVGGIIADGWYAGYVGYGHKRDHYGRAPWLLAQLEVEYADGGTEIIATDPSWTAGFGPILEADFLMGETYDASREMSRWSQAGFDASAWKAADVKSEVSAKVQAYPGVTVQKFAEHRPKSITEPKPDLYVLDMGTNFAGFARLKVNAEPGRAVTLRFAERLNPDGTIYTENLRSARATDTYICRGGTLETWQPQFTFHGFQYVQVEGLPEEPAADTVTGIEVTSATAVAGGFRCSDAMVNQLYDNICQTQRANFIDIPTDCPQRDERLGWTGDAQVFVRAATYNNDVQAFFTKWLRDLMDAQRDDGQFPMVAPLLVAGDDGGPAWADAGIICPWAMYWVYQDRRIIEKYYDRMARFIEFRVNRSTDEMLPPEQFHCFGDWLNINAETPKEIIYMAYFAHTTKLMARMADALGKDADAKKYNALFERIKESFNQAYVYGGGKIRGDTQCGYVLALAYDLLEGPVQKLAAARLIEKIKERDWHLSTGFVGTKDLMLVLTKIGRTDVAYRLLHNTTFPSWGFSIKHGATSIWERWDGWTPDKGFQDPGMNSFAHYSFGAVGQWMFQTIGGIQTAGPGFKKIIIRPQPGGELTWAKTSYQSIHGTIASEWKLQDDALYLDVTIPANTTGVVYVAADGPDAVTESGKAASASPGVTFLRMTDSAVVYEVRAGRYKFVSEPAG